MKWGIASGFRARVYFAGALAPTSKVSTVMFDGKSCPAAGQAGHRMSEVVCHRVGDMTVMGMSLEENEDLGSSLATPKRNAFSHLKC